MPIYEYTCQVCGLEFEELIWNRSNIDEVHCPFCESAEVKKKISIFGPKAGASSGSTWNINSSCGASSV